MCQLSAHLKLCSCSKTDFETVENYWVFHRRQAPSETQEMIVGELLLPISLEPETEVLNEQTLLHILNEEAPFDVDLKPKQHDRLSLHFACRQEILVYGFRYYRGKWVPEEWDNFTWYWRHAEERAGEIRDAF